MASTSRSSSAHHDLTDVRRVLDSNLVEVPVLRKSGPGPNLYLNDSALETVDSSISSLEVESLRVSSRLASDKVRRRGSELSRVRPPVVRSDSDGAFELTPMPPLAHVEGAQATRFAVDTEDRVRDVEIGPSISNSVAASFRSVLNEETTSTAPILSAAQKSQQKLRSYFHFGALCWSFFLEGWNDGSTGPLLPAIQKHYDIGFTIVSLLFVLNCIGFISGAAMNVYLTDRLGFGKVLVLGAVLQLVAYALLSPAGPFPLMCTGFCFAGFGISLQNAQGNGFVGGLRDNASTMLGLLHASYGLGAFAAPLVATHFSQGQHWSFHYLISAGIGVSNVAILSWVFRFKNQDDVMAEAGHAPVEEDTAGGSKYRQIMGIRAVHYLACWALIYVGVEVTLGGWIVTFIEQKRGGSATAGYISSGFFGGLMLGRLSLMWLNRKIGERRVMYIYAFLAIQLEVTIWVVPSLFENALAVAFIGLLLGPMYPILVKQSRDILPKWLFTACVGWISGVGQAGSAILPFITGLLASKFGIGALQPLIVSMMSTMIVIWAFVPRMRRMD